MSAQPGTIRIKRGTEERWRWDEIPAYRVGAWLAVHERISGDGNFGITHVPTGQSLGVWPSEAAALRAADELSEIGGDRWSEFTSSADIPASFEAEIIYALRERIPWEEVL